MGRSRSKYNSKARQSVQTVIDDSKEKKIKVDFSDVNERKYDGSNVLVLPSEKRATKKVRDKNAQPVKLLSKKQRKKLTKIVDQKKKKENRASLLAALDTVKANPKDLVQLTQLQATQTLGRKKFLTEGFSNITTKDIAEDEEKVISAIKGKKRKRSIEEKVHDPSIIRLGEVSSSDDDDDDEDEEYNGKNDSEDEPMSEQDTLNDTENEDPTANLTSSDGCVQETSEKKHEEKNSIENVTVVKKTIAGIPAVFVTLERNPAIQENRLKLPILAEEQVIMEAIAENPVTVVVGATGSGKTTQVPQFLYEAGYASNGKMIGVTEPRRVAAIAMSERVGEEMNLTSKEVSYQIRFEGNAGAETRLKFMTDGVLLKEIQLDPSLKKYSAIIIDEAHERSVFSDILIGILSRIIPRRAAKNKPLKLIIMSATLRVEDFTTNERLFKTCIPPVIKVDARMFDVTIHYNKRTNDDYLAEALKKVNKIHQQLPEGGILIFLTGQQEVNTLVRKLRAAYPYRGKFEQEEGTNISGYKRKRLEVKEKKKARKKGEEPSKKVVLKNIKLDDYVSALPDDEDEHEDVDADIDPLEDSDLDLNDDDDEEQTSQPKRGTGEDQQPLWVLPMYSMLPPERQRAIFEPPPPGTRLCVVATNVAETSLTIPNIKYVVDSGKVKEKVFDKVTGVSMFHVTWVSQASANQRAGRAGRTAPGHCYRLFSSAIFNDEFAKFATAEIQRRPIDDLVLVMKSMNLPVINFPFPTPPDYLQIRQAVRRLVILGALKDQSGSSSSTAPPRRKKNSDPAKDLTRITPLGSAMAAFPLAPRYAKMLALSHQHDLLPYTIALVSALTVQEVLIETPLDTKETVNDLRKKWQSLRLSWAGSGASRMLGDNMVLLRAVGAAQFNGGTREWCDMNGLRHKGITEIFKLRRQLTNEINLILPSCSIILDPNMPPPTTEQARLLQQIVLSGSVDHVARRVDDWEVKNPEDKPKWRNAYRTMELEDPVFLPSSSVLRIDMPQWVVYQDVYETNKMFMRNVTAVEPSWLPVFAPNLCVFSPPLETPPPSYDQESDRIICHCTATFGPSSWKLPDAEVEFPHGRDLFRWVAYFFLIGQLCPALSKFTEYIYEPKTLISAVAIRYREIRESLLRALMSQDITNYEKLMAVWKKNPNFLRKEYLLWINDDLTKQEVMKIWPPLSIVDEETQWD